MSLDQQRTAKLRLELRRGAIILGVLAALPNPHYGYSLRKKLAQSGLDVDEGTLYPLLRRLEEQGLLASEWQECEGRKRRFYRVSADGVEALNQMQQDWQQLNQALLPLLEGLK